MCIVVEVLSAKTPWYAISPVDHLQIHKMRRKNGIFEGGATIQGIIQLDVVWNETLIPKESVSVFVLFLGSPITTYASPPILSMAHKPAVYQDGIIYCFWNLTYKKLNKENTRNPQNRLFIVHEVADFDLWDQRNIPSLMWILPKMGDHHFVIKTLYVKSLL